MSVSARVTAGATGGVVGSVLMGGPYLAARKVGIIGKPPPEGITEGLLHRAGVRAGPETEDAVSVVAHLGFGGVAGALYGLVAPRAASVGRTLAFGAAYGTSIWAVSYAGWVPALRLMPPPTRDQPERQIVVFVNHWIYGAAVALAVRSVDRRLDDTGVDSY
jgi:uncharacterized membrane protein YagU involved in acid resistance